VPRPLDKVQRSDKMHLGPARLRAVIGGALAAGTFVVCHYTLTYGNPDFGPAICRDSMRPTPPGHQR
jgi:hypothetical protein